MHDSNPITTCKKRKKTMSERGQGGGLRRAFVHELFLRTWSTDDLLLKVISEVGSGTRFPRDLISLFSHRHRVPPGKSWAGREKRQGVWCHVLQY